MNETKRVIPVPPRQRIAAEKNTVQLRMYVSGRRNFMTIKRIFDIFFSICVLVGIFSWLFPILYVLIRLDSKGPVFFVQKRVGFLGRSFSCLKFRTMRINDEANTKQAADDDPRITRMGRFLRNSNLDELPQFLNVLAGHMSIVGPRPHMYKDCARFSSVVDSYKFRSVMKPGITGLAQVKGRNDISWEKKFELDVYYVDHYSLRLDLRIWRMTFASVLMREGISQRGHATASPFLGSKQEASE